MSLPQERSTAELVFYTWVARSRSESSSFTASALNKLSSSSPSSSRRGPIRGQMPGLYQDQKRPTSRLQEADILVKRGTDNETFICPQFCVPRTAWPR